MTVQHVHVAEGGQAIVGNVNAPAEGVGARKKSEDQPHAQLTYAPGGEMPRQIEAERATVPSAGGAGRGARPEETDQRPRSHGPRDDGGNRVGMGRSFRGHGPALLGGQKGWPYLWTFLESSPF
jgi:hypothetical protein